MATTTEKAATEEHARDFLRENGLPQPDEVEYGETCIWLLFHEPKTALRIDIDEDPHFDYENGVDLHDPPLPYVPYGPNAPETG